MVMTIVGIFAISFLIAVPLAFLCATAFPRFDYFDDGWKKVREEGDFIVYSKKPWYRDKPFELYVLKKKGKSVIFKGIEKESK